MSRTSNILGATSLAQVNSSSNVDRGADKLAPKDTGQTGNKVNDNRDSNTDRSVNKQISLNPINMGIGSNLDEVIFDFTESA